LLPLPLAYADRSAVFDTIVSIAAAIAPEDGWLELDEPHEQLHRLHTACTYVLKGPTGIEHAAWDGGASGHLIRRVTRQWATLWHHPTPRKRPSRTALQRPSPTDGVVEPVRMRRAPWIAKQSPEVQHAPLARPSPPDEPPVGIRKASEIAKLSPEVLHAAWTHGLVDQEQRFHGEKTLPAFHPAQLRALGEAWRARIEPQAVAYELGISLHGVEQLAALSSQGPAGTGLPANALGIPGTAPCFRRDDLDRFIADFEPLALPALPDPTPLKHAIRRIGGRAKPWGPILRLLLDGTVPFCLQGQGALADRLHVSARQVATITRCAFHREEHPNHPFSSKMVQRDALELLNTSATHVRVLQGLKSTGRNPKTYDVADVERRSREIATIPEIAALLGVNPATAYCILSRNPASAAAWPGCWRRDALTDLLTSPHGTAEV
jgi:hypothetical protein